MSRKISFFAVSLISLLFIVGGNGVVAAQDATRKVEQVSGGEWIWVPRPEIVETSKNVLAKPDIPLRAEESIIRVRALEMDWDIAAMVYEPVDASRIPTGADGKKVGILVLHGGSGDHKSKDRFSRFLTSKFGFKVVNMSYPGRLNLQDPSRDWPGDTIRPDGTVRTPVWKRDSMITPDQYEVVHDREDSRRRRWGTLTLACAKEGTEFYNRMAGWPVAFEEGGREMLGRHLPEQEYSIYAHGHSTGGPFTMMLSQRVTNIQGIIGMESSPFGSLYGQMTREIQGISEPWGMDFNCLRIRSWRDTARYHGYELVQEEGVKALERLAMVMEEVHESWARSTKRPQFKAENILHFDNSTAMGSAARATAKRLGLNSQQTEGLVARYIGYLREVSGPGAKPVPPLMLIITKNSRDHAPEIYREVYLPRYAAMNPAPKFRVYQFDAGIHGYSAPEAGLPAGVAPMGVQLWYDAIMGGFYTDDGH